MKKLLSLALLVIIQISNLISQEEIKQFPPIYQKHPEVVIEKIIGSDQTGFYATFLNKKEKKYSLDKFDLEGKPVFSAKFEKSPHVVLNNNTAYAFTIDFKDKKAKLLESEVQLNSGAVSSPVQISEIEVRKEHDYNFYYCLSPDKTKLLIVSKFFCVSDELPEKCIFQFYEINGMKKIWEKEIDNQYKEQYVSTDAYKVDNEGNVFLYYQYSKSIMALKAYTGNTAIGIIRSKEKGFVEIALNFDPNIELPSFSSKLTNDNKLIIASVYRDVEKKDQLRRSGIYFVVIDMKTGKALATNTKALDENVEKKLSYKVKTSVVTSVEHGSGDLFFNSEEIVEMHNNYYFVAENYSSRLLVTKINPSAGTIEWEKVIPKNGSNYHVFAANNKINFVYLDHPGNAKYQFDEVDFGDMGAIQGVHNSDVLLVTVDPTSQATKKIIHENKENCVMPQNVNIVLNNNSLLLYMENNRDKERSFGLITAN